LLVDSDGRTIAVIELISVDVIRMRDVDRQLAHEEGEGFASAEDWRGTRALLEW
jgi:uncharacterized protein YhfF